MRRRSTAIYRLYCIHGRARFTGARFLQRVLIARNANRTVIARPMLSVCPSVCPSRSGVLSGRMKEDTIVRY